MLLDQFRNYNDLVQQIESYLMSLPRNRFNFALVGASSGFSFVPAVKVKEPH